ncbi:MAG: 2'-5' RNA ligase family protein [Bacteroidetes bacterium]|jgi:2'-5' RNA ligase|nr:2'-5' RNA ligase family protein [Bacteroidota bacterium]MDF1866887.1 2'-5' RNA ligase family protein [Saprospiraceae bacterium]
MQDPIFFVAILPPEKIQEKVTSLKEYAFRKFNSSHALKSPPHITLQPPFRWSLKKLKRLKDSLKVFSKTKVPFLIELNHWDHFSDKVIFIDITPNPQLIDFQEWISTHLVDELRLKKDHRPYHPHMTVAFKDLKSYLFERAWAHFSDIHFVEKFEVNEIFLLRHNGKRWDIIDNYTLGS